MASMFSCVLLLSVSMVCHWVFGLIMTMVFRCVIMIVMIVFSVCAMSVIGLRRRHYTVFLAGCMELV